MIQIVRPVFTEKAPMLIVMAIMVAISGIVDAPDLLAVNPVPGLLPGGVQSGDVAEPSFTGTGRIDRIGSGFIVIDDGVCRLSPHFSCYNHLNQPIPFSLFRTGTRVGYRTNTNRQIVQLWLLPNN